MLPYALPDHSHKGVNPAMSHIEHFRCLVYANYGFNQRQPSQVFLLLSGKSSGGDPI